MIDANESKILAMLGPNDVVLDVGGWARPFNRANYVIDCAPYASRGEHYIKHQNLFPQGGPVEYFTEETWIRRDICDHEPWPFADKSIDFCICSHTLEDIRDPIWVCHEIRRVAKRGYIEVPSRLFETSRGRAPGVPVGLGHHRWLVEIEGTNITFFVKDHRIDGDFRLSIPKSFWQTLPEEHFTSGMFWEGDFTFAEGFMIGDDGVPDRTANYRAFVDRWYTYTEAEAATLERIQADYLRRLDTLELPVRILPAPPELPTRTVRTDPAEEFGPIALGVARRIKQLSARHPRLAAAVKRVLRGAE